jgi:UDP-3-O-[3-hydroxymyristoyl] glucosamine N-acyltransferase
MMGCRIGRWVFLETTLFSEFDLVEIGDHAAINLGSTIQTHLFEDRVMKADYLKIGRDCTVGNMAVVLYGSEMKQGASLGAMSVLMKGEALPERTQWVGIPTRPAEAPKKPAAGSRRSPRTARRKAAPDRRDPARNRLLTSSSMTPAVRKGQERFVSGERTASEPTAML